MTRIGTNTIRREIFPFMYRDQTALNTRPEIRYATAFSAVNIVPSEKE